ncbi:MAG: 50S ribosomal protein L23 [Nitrospirae bacterium]|nr:50S ribosomal protein L23 [Nitrospirota bacterium]
MDNYSTIIRSITTEKSSAQQANGQYMFQINKKATKVDVKHAVKTIYGVDVDKVRIIISPSKKRLVAKGKLLTKRPVMKKALITIKDKKTIDPNKINSAKQTKK